MATNPYFTQYHTQRFSFIGSPQQRDGTSYLKDQRFLNMYPELITSPISDGKKYYLKKRPGTGVMTTVPTGTSQGIFFWPAINTYFFGIGGLFYYWPLGGGAPTVLFALTQSTNPIGIVEYNTNNNDLLFICDGQTAWIVHSNFTWQQVTSAGLPNPHIPTPVFLDGYIFLAGRGNQRIYNSAVTDPTTWPSDGFIDAEMYPDQLVGLAKVQNYIACIGSGSIEWLYDNANATGSPLQRNAPAVSQFGCPAPFTINQTERELILVGATGNGGRTVWLVDGFQPTEIGNAPVREALDNEGSTIVGAWANTIQSCGHKWYILNLTGSNRTFVFDFEEKMWHEWSSGTAQSQFFGRFAADNIGGVPIWMSTTGGALYYMGPGFYTDNGTTIDCEITTVKIDFDSIKRKRFYRLSLTCDGPNGDINVPMTIYWSDDDYNTWSSGTTLQVNSSYPTIAQLGYGRRRSFRFSFQQPYPLRMESFELDVIQEVRR